MMLFSVLVVLNCIQLVLTVFALVSRYVIGEGSHQVQLRNIELKQKLRKANEDLEAFGNYLTTGSSDISDSIVQEMKIDGFKNIRDAE